VDGNTVTVQLYRLDANSSLVRVGNMKLTRVSGPAVATRLPADPRRPKETAVLDRLVGEWRTEVTAGGSPKPVTMRTTGEAILGGRFVEVNDGDGTGGYMIAWFDPAANRYRLWAFRPTGEVEAYRGTWDDAVRTMTWNTQDGRLEKSWVFNETDDREFRHRVKDPEGHILNEVTGVSRRVTPATLDGKWVFEAAEYKGEPVPADKAKESFPSEMILKGDQYGLTWSGKRHEGGLKVDARKTPAEVDFTGSVFAGLKPRKAIYELSGDRLRLCLPLVGPDADPPRPTAFTTAAESRNAVIVYRRDRSPSPTDAAVAGPLREAVTAKETVRDTVKVRVEAGAASGLDLVRADIDLDEARVLLAEAERDAAAVRARLQELIRHREEERKLVAEVVAAGREPRTALDAVDAKVAEAKARLARVRPGDASKK
jgi:uncharacterized protein (TIGR03067 family)